MRLLLVEDEPSLRESVARKLHRAGYETDDCGDGETSSKRIINAPYINCVSVYYHYNSFC